jgi:hypothetical protein
MYVMVASGRIQNDCKTQNKVREPGNSQLPSPALYIDRASWEHSVDVIYDTVLIRMAIICP